MSKQRSIMEFVGLNVAAANPPPAGEKKKASSSGITTTVRRSKPHAYTTTRAGAVVRGMYNVRVASLSPEQISMIEAKLTVKPRVNPTFATGKATRYPLFFRSNTWLSLPRFYGMSTLGAPEESRLTDGEPLRASLTMDPRDYQIKVLESLQSIFSVPHSPGAGAILEADCGTGKTAMAIAASCRHGRRTAIVVHKSDLQQQWVERLEAFTEGGSVGTVRGDKIDADHDFVIFMAQSVVTGRYPKELFESFGMLIVDEAHHWAAPTLSKTMAYFPSRCLLALTATPDRKDGLGFVLPWYFGTTVALVKRQAQSGVTVEIVRRASGRAKEIRLRNGNPCLSRTISMMVADEERNQYIVSRILELRQQGRYIIVLSVRRKRLATLREMLEAQLENPEEVGTFAGETTKGGVARRESERKRPVLLATVRMAEEGFDEARLDTLIFATPKSNIQQCVGRIQRSHPEKQEPLIVDIFDSYAGGAMHGMHRARKKFYESCKFNILTL